MLRKWEKLQVSEVLANNVNGYKESESKINMFSPCNFVLNLIIFRLWLQRVYQGAGSPLEARERKRQVRKENLYSLTVEGIQV